MRNWIRLVESADWRAQVRQLQADAKAEHVNLDIDTEADDKMLLIDFDRVWPSAKGAGGKFLQRLCDIADQNDLEISLAVAGGARGLVSYYERFGFEMDMELHQHEAGETGTHPEADEDSFGYEVSMYRIPRWNA